MNREPIDPYADNEGWCYTCGDLATGDDVAPVVYRLRAENAELQAKVARIEALAQWMRDAGWVNIYETSEELACAVERALSGAPCGASCPPNCHSQHAPRFIDQNGAWRS